MQNPVVIDARFQQTDKFALQSLFKHSSYNTVLSTHNSRLTRLKIVLGHPLYQILPALQPTAAARQIPPFTLLC